MKTLLVIGLAVRLFSQPVSAEASAAGDRVRETVDELLTILKDPQLKGEHKSSERREKLKAVTRRRVAPPQPGGAKEIRRMKGKKFSAPATKS